MKFCKDCRHYEPYRTGRSDLAKCWANPRVNMVDGSATPRYCDMQRGNEYSSNPCGPEAKFFESIVKSSPEQIDNRQEVSHNPSFIEQVVKFFKRS